MCLLLDLSHHPGDFAAFYGIKLLWCLELPARPDGRMGHMQNGWR